MSTSKQIRSPSIDSDLVREIRLELAIRKYIEGNSYVKSKHLADGLEATSYEIGNAMRTLKSNGDVSEWGKANGAITWEILL